MNTNKRNTAKEKKKENNKYPYKHGGKDRCKKRFWRTMLDILNESNIKVEEFQAKAMTKIIDKEMKKEEKAKQKV